MARPSNLRRPRARIKFHLTIKRAASYTSSPRGCQRSHRPRPSSPEQGFKNPHWVSRRGFDRGDIYSYHGEVQMGDGTDLQESVRVYFLA